MEWFCWSYNLLNYVAFILVYMLVTTWITNLMSLVKYKDIDLLCQLIGKYISQLIEKPIFMTGFRRSRLSQLINLMFVLLQEVNLITGKFNTAPTLSGEFENKDSLKQSNLRQKITEFFNETLMNKLHSKFSTGPTKSQLSRIINFAYIILSVELRKGFLHAFIDEYKHLLPYCVPRSIKGKAFVIENARLFMKIDTKSALKNALHFPILWAQYVERKICRAIESDCLYVRMVAKEDNMRKLLIKIMRDSDSELEFKCELTLRICLDSPPEEPDKEDCEDSQNINQTEQKMLMGTFKSFSTPTEDDGFLKYGSYFVALLLLAQAYIVFGIIY